MRVFADEEKYKAAKYTAIPEEAGALATIDIRSSKNAYKSMIADLTNVICDSVVFNVADVPDGYDSARVVAAKYYKGTS